MILEQLKKENKELKELNKKFTTELELENKKNILKMQEIKDLVRIEIPQCLAHLNPTKDMLLKMCESSKHKPILKDNQPIGIIQDSVVNNTQDGIISYGILFGNVKSEFEVINDTFTSFSINAIHLQ
jgi:hypothetical protein